jgi:F-type H+-transporting ATPase subunit gamma
MPSLKDLKNRIESVKNTRKITKAMQMVAAAKLRRAQEAAEAGRPYAERFNAVMGSLGGISRRFGLCSDAAAWYGIDQSHLLVVMTSERGLCGGFNRTSQNLQNSAQRNLLLQGKTVKIMTVGKKGRDNMKRDFGDHFIEHVDLTEVKRIGYSNAQDIAKGILDLALRQESSTLQPFSIRALSTS